MSRDPDDVLGNMTLNAYVDPIGVCWPVSKLDALLIDSDVSATVDAAMLAGWQWHGYSSNLVYAWALRKYRRPIVAGLLLMLVTRRRDLQAQTGEGEGYGPV